MKDTIKDFNELSKLEKLYEDWEKNLSKSLNVSQLEKLATDIEANEQNGPQYVEPVHLTSFQKIALSPDCYSFKEACSLTEQFLHYVDHNLDTMLNDIPAETAKSALPDDAQGLKPIAAKYQLPNFQKLIG